MGVIDEHWCSECKKKLDKAKEKYIETELLNDKDPNKFDRVWLCQKCAKAKKIKFGNQEVSVWSFVQKLRKRNNPSFELSIQCHSAPVCETYEPRSRGPNCKHIAVTPAGRVYCKRLHPGYVNLAQEKSLVEKYKRDVNEEMTAAYCKRIGFDNPADALKTLGLDVRNLHRPIRPEPLAEDPKLRKKTLAAMKKAGIEPLER